MQSNKIIIAVILFVLLAAHFLLMPSVQKKTITKICETALIHWKNNDISKIYNLWIKEEKAPPVYDLLSYTIDDYRKFKIEGTHYAKVYVTLEFAPQNILPSGEQWVFNLTHTRWGWKIKNFILASNDSEPEEF